ncbi:outer membrane beta-barrel protein [Solitalea lacus]|uniref:outer membrane beta-barrel protein n=1 Tax=Solitalea lacus TaxID=2911172 RepID=UPI001EDC8FD5|nr:outer membrane beta-barrel protein [Solitalea lacus]UKJ07241.1 PorT family protein [Solitalea lacus]
MEERFDKLLSEQIRSVFDQYDDGLANEGWNKLLEKKQAAERKNKKVVPLWLLSIVSTAAVLTFFVLNLNYLKNDKVNAPNNAFNTKHVTKREVKALTQNLEEGYSEKIKTFTNEESVLITSSSNSKAKVQRSNGSLIEKYNEPEVFNKADVVDERYFLVSLSPQPLANEQLRTPEIIQRELRTISKSPQPIVTNSIKEYIAGETKNKEGVDFSMMAGSFMSYAKGSSGNNLGYRAGFDVDIPISPKVQINTGLSLGNQSLAFNTTNTTHSLPAAVEAKAYKINTVSNVLSAPESYKTSMLAVDLPINVKIVFPETKYAWFISGGFSSYTYLDESNSTVYSAYPFGAASAFDATSKFETEENTGKVFSRFDWFKTLNLSFGVNYALKNSKLQVEPFVKYPLSGIGADQLKWNSVGLNLKLSFSN